MYGLFIDGPHIALTKDFGENVNVKIAGFVVPFGAAAEDVVKLAKEMVAVLNRDLENRANDIAATLENIATSDLPPTEDDEHRKLWANAPTGCGDTTCQIHYPADPNLPSDAKDWQLHVESYKDDGGCGQLMCGVCRGPGKTLDEINRNRRFYGIEEI